MNKMLFFYSGLINAINYNPNLTPDEIAKSYQGFPAIRVHNKDWRPEFNGLIPGVVSVIPPQELETRVKFLRNKFCTHIIKVFSEDEPHNAKIFSGTFINLSIADVAAMWQKTALKTYLGHGGLGKAPYVDCVIFSDNGELKLYAPCPENTNEKVWENSCVEIAEKIGLLNCGFSLVNMQKVD